jgi:hypothetical protein
MMVLVGGLLANWSAPMLGGVCIAVGSGTVTGLLAYMSHISKRYLGLTCFSTLYALRSGSKYFIEWIPIKVQSMPIEVGGKRMYLNEVICHPDSDLPYLLLVTPDEFDINGGKICKTQVDVKFWRGVKCPINLGYMVAVDLRAMDIGVTPGEMGGLKEIEKNIPVPLLYVVASDYVYEKVWEKAGLLYPERDVVDKSIIAVDSLYARYYKEKCEMLSKKVEELERIELDAKKMAAEMFKKAMKEKFVFEKPPIQAQAGWFAPENRKKLVGLILAIAASVLAVVLLLLLVVR